MKIYGRIVTDEKYDVLVLCFLSAAIGFMFATMLLLP